MIRYRDLSTPLKIAIVSAYVIAGLYLFFFAIGFLIGLSQALN